MADSRTGTLIERVDELVTLSYTAANDEKGWLLAEAQVNATLALVEQQRVANVIAAHAASGPHEYTPLDVMTNRTRMNVYPELFGDEMKEAHGG